MKITALGARQRIAADDRKAASFAQVRERRVRRPCEWIVAEFFPWKRGGWRSAKPTN
jgi:hypothetical protein